MSKTYTSISQQDYIVERHGAIEGIRVYYGADGFSIKAEIKTAFHYIFTIDWTNGELRNNLLKQGANGYTYLYDERVTKPSWSTV